MIYAVPSSEDYIVPSMLPKVPPPGYLEKKEAFDVRQIVPSPDRPLVAPVYFSRVTHESRPEFAATQRWEKAT